MKEIREAVVKIAERVTLAEICARSRQMANESSSPIDFVI